MSVATAGFPETLARGGRVCGCCWGDGYHTCHSSGVRPLADLPPRSYAARVGTPQERIAGCPTCQPRRLPSVDPITSPRGPETFYHRFDQYAAQVSHREAQASSRGPVQPIIDPEAGVAAPRYERETHAIHSLPQNRLLNSTRGSVNATADGTPAAPALSVQELEELRQLQAEQRLRKKFEKYLINPEDIEPSQTFGGPPVGTELRRKLDEAKTEQLQAQLRQERLERFRREDEQLDSTKPFSGDSNAEGEDGMNSPSDRELPLDTLLPPFPQKEELREEELLQDQPLPFPKQYDELDVEILDEEILDGETVPQRITEPLDNLDSARPSRLQQTQLDFNAPIRSSHPVPSVQSSHAPTPGNAVRPKQSAESQRAAATQQTPQTALQPEARVAEIPDWRFVKQPR
ncbi:hypothetical protein [Aporhodopirellula aestuarii]|uniref:Uncharacterized protein n=1 Tax=Aporhodopirellula aestuarii TaxID=2950107 RepID=A0ABT0TXH3_9BACT|nr:hypothetical protein [Aporhodopirellula aestuarii]MCM2369235.1 hypothetical protein [Aporhodopirellula aestuarii]